MKLLFQQRSITAFQRWGKSSFSSSYSRNYSTPNEQDFIHVSQVPTDYFQKSLPKLPLPSLENTCKRYLTSLQPLVSSEELENTTSIVHKFLQGEGRDLQQALKEKDENFSDSSYVADYWNDMYLCTEEPLVWDFGAAMMISMDPRPAYNSQTIRAANLSVSILRFMKSLQANVLKPYVFPASRKMPKSLIKELPIYDKEGNQVDSKIVIPVDQSQWKHLFNSTRIPKIGRDELRLTPGTKHIAVLRNGHIYTFDVLDSNSNILPGKEILSKFQHILNDNTPKPEHPIGILTAGRRNTWAELREKLENQGNKAQLQMIDSAIFMILLEEESSDDMATFVRCVLDGKGYNRWFDKNFTMVVGSSGALGCSMEHSWADGMACVRLLEDCFEDMANKPAVTPETSPASIDDSTAVTRLDFHLSDEIKTAVEQGQKEYNAKVESLDMRGLIYNGLNKNDFIKQKLSPDSMIQLAFQLAFKRSYGETVSTYESCSTSIFNKGRTETMRPCTYLTKEACEMFDRVSRRPSVGEILAKLTDCSKMHSKLIGEATIGQGFDRHLFALRKFAESQGFVPAIFQDTAYFKMCNIILSTSTLGEIPCLYMAGFPPVTPSGLGIAYAITQEQVRCTVSNYKATRNGREFTDALSQTFKDMRTIMDGADFKH